MKDKHGNTLVVNRRVVAIYGAVLAVVAIALGIAYETGAIGGKYLPAPASGVQRLPITHDDSGAPQVYAPAATFTRRDGAIVSISLEPYDDLGSGRLSFDAWVGADALSQHAPPIEIAVGQSAVLDGVRVTLVAIWTGSKYRSDAIDLRLADASP